MGPEELDPALVVFGAAALNALLSGARPGQARSDIVANAAAYARELKKALDNPPAPE